MSLRKLKSKWYEKFNDTSYENLLLLYYKLVMLKCGMKMIDSIVDH